MQLANWDLIQTFRAIRNLAIRNEWRAKRIRDICDSMIKALKLGEGE